MKSTRRHAAPCTLLESATPVDRTRVTGAASTTPDVDTEAVVIKNEIATNRPMDERAFDRPTTVSFVALSAGQ